MPRAKSDKCPRCLRPFATTPDPLLQNPAEKDLLKRKANLAVCVPCFSYGNSHPEYRNMTSAAILEDLQRPGKQETYCEGLSQWESGRREGKRSSGTSKTSVKAQASHGTSTRELKGYLWTASLLKRHNLLHLWSGPKAQPKQTIQHMGRTVTGILREEHVFGVIEIYQSSETKALREHQVMEDDGEENGENGADCEQSFRQLASQLDLNMVPNEPTDGQAESTGGFNLRSKKAKTDADLDDFVSVWGLSSFAAAGGHKGAKARPGGAEKDQAVEDGAAPAASSNAPVKKQRTKKTTPDLGLGSREAATSDVASQSEQGLADTASTSWMFGTGRVPKPGKGKAAGQGGKNSKELDATEKVINSFAGLKGLLADEETFMNVTFQKCTAMSQKIEARNSPELQKVYRHLAAEEQCEKAVNIMRDIAEAVHQVELMAELVAALTDKNAAAATIQEHLRAAREAGIPVTKCCEKLYYARHLQELSKSLAWTDYYEALLCDQMKAMFGDDDVALAEFQLTAFKSAVIAQLNQEIVVPADTAPAAADPRSNSSQDQAAVQNADAAAYQKAAKKLCGVLCQCLHCFSESRLCEDWKSSAVLAPFLDEVEKLQLLVDIATAESDGVMEESEVEALNRHGRLQLVGNAFVLLGRLHEALQHHLKAIVEVSQELTVTVECLDSDIGGIGDMLPHWEKKEAAGFAPMPQPTLQKCLGERSKEVMDKLQFAKQLFGAFQKAAPAVVDLCNSAKKPLSPVGNEIRDLMQTANSQNHARAIEALAPEVSQLVRELLGCMRTNAMLAIAQDCKAFAAFASFFVEGGAVMEHILLESIVGELQEDELTGRTDYGAIYDLYGKHIPPEWCALEHRASGGRKVAISCSALCSAAGLLPLAKALTHMSKVFVDLGRCASASAALGPACTDVPNALGMSLLVKLGDLKDRPGTLMESLRSARAVLALTKNPMAETFCKGCETRIPNLLTKMIQITCEEFDAIKAVALQKTYESIASVSEFMKQLDTEDFQSDLADKVCGDAGMQKLYMWLLQGQNMMYGLRDLLTKIATCCEQGLDCSAVARSGPHIVSLRIITARLGQDEASLRAMLANLESKLENLLGFPSLLLSSSVADSSELPSNLLPVGHRIGLRSSEDLYFGLDDAGSWSFTFNSTSERHLLEVLDVGDGNVALRSVASHFHYLEAVMSNGTAMCGGSSSVPSNWNGFRFRAKELSSTMGERKLMLVSVDFGVVLSASASGACSWTPWEVAEEAHSYIKRVKTETLLGQKMVEGLEFVLSLLATAGALAVAGSLANVCLVSLGICIPVNLVLNVAAFLSACFSPEFMKELGSNVSDDAVLVVQDIADAASADVVDQDGREISSAGGVQITTDWFSVLSGSGPNASWLQVPLSWEGVTAPPLMGKLVFGVWEQPLWVSPDGPGDGGSEDTDGGQPGENPGDDGVDPGSWQDWSNWQSANPSSDGSRVNRTRLVIEVHDEGPFHPLPTWLGSCLSALLAVMIIGTVAYYFRGHWQCRKSKVLPVPSHPTQWTPSGQDKNTWAPRVAGEEVVPEEDAPAEGLEPSFKARAMAQDTGIPKAAPVASWITGGELASSSAEPAAANDQMAKSKQGPSFSREGSRVGRAEDELHGSRALERASSLRYAGAHTAAALADHPTQPTAEEVRAEEREARHERV
ncbi:unnamed protein product, partial [Symbiodinium microadriaticum]